MHVPEDKTKRKMEFAGLPIDVQFDKGDRRHYPAANGFPEYNVVMKAIYGEVPRTKGTDGDPVDVYIGTDASSDKVFIIRQMKFPKYEVFDEEKCMLGFNTADEAKSCYLKHHQSKKIFGGIKELTMDEFKERLATRGREGKKLAAAAEIVFALRNSGVKLSADQTAAIYQNRTERGVLGIQPDTAAPPPATPFGEATQDAAKVALDLKKLTNHAAGLTAHPVAQKALNAPSPEDGLLELANPVISKVMSKAKSLVKKAAKKKQTTGEKLERAAIGAGAGVLGAVALRRGARHLVDKQIGRDVGKVLSAGASRQNASGAMGRIKALEGVRDHLHKNPDTRNGILAAGALAGAAAAKKREKKACDETPKVDWGARLKSLDDRRNGRDVSPRLKKANAAPGRVGRIAERVDDVGIGMLAAPYAARGIAGALKNRGGRLGAVGQVADRAAKAMHHHEVPLELGGLALVAPGVTNRLASGIDRVLPGRKVAPTSAGSVAGPVVPSRPVTKVAGTDLSKAKGLKRVGQLLSGSRVKDLEDAAQRSSYRAARTLASAGAGNPDVSVRKISRTAQAAGHARHLESVQRNAAAAEKEQVHKARVAATGAGVAGTLAAGVAAKKHFDKTADLEKLAMELRPDFEYLPEPEKLAYLGALRSIAARAQPMLQQGVQAVQRGVGAVRGAVQGAVNPGAAKTLVPGQTGVLNRIMTPGNVAKAGLLGAGAVGAVGAYKGVKGMANFLGGHHEHPVAPPQYDAPRVL